MSKPKHILVIRLSAMGDVAMTVPVLRALTEQYPTLKITILTREFFTPFFRDLSNVSVFHADVKGAHKGVLGLYHLSKTIKRLDLDGIADLHNVLRSKILKYFLSSIPFQIIDKGRSEKKALTSGKIKKQLKTTHQRYADVFEKLGFPIDLKQPKFPEKSKLDNSIIVRDEKKWVGIALFAQYESKMYPLNLMEKVIETLSEKYKIILFGGGAQEIKTLSHIANKYENVINLAGKVSLNEELDVISNLDIMLSMDSGNAHVAAMLGKKVITIWGVTHPNAGFSPFNQPKHYALLADKNKYPLIPTSIYGNKYPDNYKEAAGSISPERVISTLESIL